MKIIQCGLTEVPLWPFQCVAPSLLQKWQAISQQLQLSSVPILLKESLEPDALSGKPRAQQPLHPPSLHPCQSTILRQELSTSTAGWDTTIPRDLHWPKVGAFGVWMPRFV